MQFNLTSSFSSLGRENAGESIVYLWVERVRQFMVEFGEEEDTPAPASEEVRLTVSCALFLCVDRTCVIQGK